MTEPKHYGMHRHFTEVSSILMFGGGIRKGFLIRRDRGGATLQNRRKPDDDSRSARHAVPRFGHPARFGLRS